MPPFRVRVTADPDVVGRIQEGRIDRSIVANDRTKEVEVAAIAATNAMLATNPDIAEVAAGLDRNGRNRLVVRVALRVEQHIDLAGRKPRERKIEIDLEVGKLLKLQLQQVHIPACVERNLIVGKTQRASLCLVEMRQRDRRRRVEANRFAASSRPCPAIRTPSTSMSSGLANPNCRMEAAISATCFFECVRAFRGSGLMLFIGR